MPATAGGSGEAIEDGEDAALGVPADEITGQRIEQCDGSAARERMAPRHDQHPVERTIREDVEFVDCAGLGHRLADRDADIGLALADHRHDFGAQGFLEVDGDVGVRPQIVADHAGQHIGDREHVGGDADMARARVQHLFHRVMKMLQPAQNLVGALLEDASAAVSCTPFLVG